MEESRNDDDAHAPFTKLFLFSLKAIFDSLTTITTPMERKAFDGKERDREISFDTRKWLLFAMMIEVMGGWKFIIFMPRQQLTATTLTLTIHYSQICVSACL